VDPKLLETFSKLGIPINEQKRLAGVKDVAYDYVFDSESIATTFKAELAQQGIIFCSISEAVREYPDLVRKHLGSVVSSCVQPLSPLLLSWHCCMLAAKG
jgi:Fe-S cluster assembly scaffold protein SufB